MITRRMAALVLAAMALADTALRAQTVDTIESPWMRPGGWTQVHASFGGEDGRAMVASDAMGARIVTVPSASGYVLTEARIDCVRHRIMPGQSRLSPEDSLPVGPGPVLTRPIRLDADAVRSVCAAGPDSIHDSPQQAVRDLRAAHLAAVAETHRSANAH